jgi:magnesium chelatase family protein
LTGAGAELVTVEARLEPADRERTEVVLSGLPDPVIRESRGRLLCALEANRLRLPAGRLYLNLAPAGRRKSGEALDLPLALGAVAAAGHVDPRALAGTLFLGELGIDGRLHAVPGGLAAARAARTAGIGRLVAPPTTADEAAGMPGLEVLSAVDLAAVVHWSAGGDPLPRAAHTPPREAPSPGAELDAIRGQEQGKRALVVAAAGGHALLFLGPPGTGKTLLARALAGLLPPLDLEERMEVEAIRSAAGLRSGRRCAARPFRAPHHTAGPVGLVGGGTPPAAGELTLAHRGVLFLDELPEFRRETLEALRTPLETGRVLIARAGRRTDLPAAAQLVAAMNPCPCGQRGHPRLRCGCSPAEVRRYRRRISGPLLDRFDLRVELPAPALEELGSAPSSTARGARAAAAVVLARARAERRQGALVNARLGTAELDRHVPLAGPVRRLLAAAVDRAGLSARGVQSLRRVARTVADLADAAEVTEAHVAEALALRAPLDRD